MLRDQENALRRLQYVTEIALPGVEKSLPQDGSAAEARMMAVRIHRRLLNEVAQMSDQVIVRLDAGLVDSALQCALELRTLGDPAAALEITAAVQKRIAKLYRLDSGNRQWRELYAKLLKERIALRTMLGEDGSASEEARLLADLVARHR